MLWKFRFRAGWSRPKGRWIIGLASWLLWSSGVAEAQTNTENDPGIQFNLSVPGARSLALGGAFLGRADDGTAAYSNPAGLVQLTTAEVSAEVRSWSFNHVFTDKGRVDGARVTGIGEDNLVGLQEGRAEDDVQGVSFLSFVYPTSKRWRVAFYRHELANFKANFRTRGNFLNIDSARNRAAEAEARLYIVNHGVSAAVGLGDPLEPSVSLGIGISYYDFFMDSTNRRYAVSGGIPGHPVGAGGDPEGPGGVYGPPLYSESNLRSIQSQNGSDGDWGVNLGFLWRANAILSVGGVYRQGPEFDFIAVQDPGPKTVPGQDFAKSASSKFRTPDIFGIGLALTLTESLKISLDYDRVEYSSLILDMIDIFSLDRVSRDGQVLGLDPELQRYELDDADEVHLGVEVDLGRLALRFGSWYDPDHRIRFNGQCANRDFRAEDPEHWPSRQAQCYRFESIFRPGEDEVHYTAGLGLSSIAIGRRAALQLDVAFDHSERADTAAISAVIRLGEH